MTTVLQVMSSAFWLAFPVKRSGMCRYYTFGKLRFYLSFETHTVVNQIPAAPERTLSRSEGRMVLSSTAHRSPLRTWIENLQAVGGGVNRGSLLVHVCEKEWLEERYYAKDGKEQWRGGRRSRSNTTPVWQRSERTKE